MATTGAGYRVAGAPYNLHSLYSFSSLIQIAADPKFTPSESNFDRALNQQTNSNLSYLSRLILKEQGRHLSEIWVVFFEEDNVEHMMYGFDDEHEVAGTGHACRRERHTVGRRGCTTRPSQL
jgi:cysteine sulfinate desulfinase/cysteine desulfurase-like protein